MRTAFLNVDFDLGKTIKDVDRTIRYVDNIIKSVRGHLTQINIVTIKDTFALGAEQKIRTWGPRGTRIAGPIRILLNLFRVTVTGDSLNKNFSITHPWSGKVPEVENAIYHPSRGRKGKYTKPIGWLIYNSILHGRKAYDIPGEGKDDRLNTKLSKKVLKFYWKKRGQKVEFNWKKEGRPLHAPAIGKVDFISSGRDLMVAKLKELAEKIKAKVASVRP